MFKVKVKRLFLRILNYKNSKKLYYVYTCDQEIKYTCKTGLWYQLLVGDRPRSKSFFFIIRLREKRVKKN